MKLFNALFFPVSILLAIFAERFVHFLFPVFPFAPAFLILVVSFWILESSARARFFIAIGMGFFLDSLSLFPFGTYMVFFSILLLAASFVKTHVARSKSRVLWLFWGASVLLFEPFLFASIGSSISFITAHPASSFWTGFVRASASSLFWAFVFSAIVVLFVSGNQLRKRA